MRVADERDEERFRQLDETIRLYQKEARAGGAVAAKAPFLPSLFRKKKGLDAMQINCDEEDLLRSKSRCSFGNNGFYVLVCVCDQPSLIAPVGQTPAQVPQLMQVSASITYCPSP